MGVTTEPGEAVAKLLRYSSEAVVENGPSVRGFSRFLVPGFPSLVSRGIREWRSDSLWAIYTGNPIRRDGMACYRAKVTGRCGVRCDRSRFAVAAVVILGVTICIVVGETRAALAQDSLPHGRKAQEAGWAEMMASMEKMHTAMASVAESDDADFDFVRLMLPHHEAAMEMAKTQLRYGKDPQMRRMAQEIITDQQSEIELMRLWLSKHQRNAQK
jgi:hypothetical protein